MYALSRQRMVVWALICAIVFTQLMIGLSFQATEANAFSQKYEAENALLNNGATKATNHQGYSGSGFVDNLWREGSEAVFYVNTTQAGLYNLDIRYANANSEWRTLTIYVNGTKALSSNFQNFSTWDNWQTKTETVNLISGSNVIAIKKEVSDKGGINLDYVQVSNDNISQTGKQITVYYRGNFQTPYVHYRKDSTNWTVEPGERMISSGLNNVYQATIFVNSNDLELTFNNGRDNTGNVALWDRNNGANYKASNIFNGASYTYEQSSGYLRQGTPDGINSGDTSSKTVTVYYKGAYSNPHIHYRVRNTGGNNDWTVQPGSKMYGVSQYPGYYSATITVNTSYLEAAFNNGSVNNQVGGNVTEWDVNGGKNYFYNNLTSGQSVTFENGSFRNGNPSGGSDNNQNFTNTGSKQVLLYYKSSSNLTPYVHYRVNNSGSGLSEWTQEPGIRMNTSDIPGYYSLNLSTSATNLEVTFNNGYVNNVITGWDRNDGANYVASNVFNGGIYTFDPATRKLTLGDPKGKFIINSDPNNTVNLYYKRTAAISNPHVYYQITYNGNVIRSQEPGIQMQSSLYTGYSFLPISLPPGVSTVEVAINGGLEGGTSVKTWDRPEGSNYYLLDLGNSTIADKKIERSIPNPNNITNEATIYYKSKMKNTFLLYRQENGLWSKDTDGLMEQSEVLGYVKKTIRTGALDNVEVRFSAMNDLSGAKELDPPASNSAYVVKTSPITARGTNLEQITTIENGEILPGKPQSGSEVTVYYKKGFSTPYLYYRIGGKFITQPGVKMVDSEIQGYAKVTVTLGEATTIDASFNDGANNYDTNNNKYYQIGRGIYTVQNGEVFPGMPNASNVITLYYMKTGFDTPFVNFKTIDGTFQKEAKIMSPSDISGYYKVELNVGNAQKIFAYFINGTNTSKQDDNSGKYYEIPVTNNAVYTLNNGILLLNKPSSTLAGNKVEVYFRQGAMPTYFYWRKPGTTKWEEPILMTVNEFNGYSKALVEAGALSSIEAYFKVGNETFDNNGNYYVFNTGASTFSNGIITQGTPIVLSKNELVIYYKTGIAQPYVFYRPQGGIFSSGEIMQPASDVSGYSVARLNLSSAPQADVYFNNGGVIDNNSGKYYTFQAGTYTFNNGAITLGAPTAANNNKLTVYYKQPQTGVTFLSYRLPGGAWTVTPGIPMMNAADAPGYGKVEIPMGAADRVDVFFDQGLGTPDNNNGQNYQLNPGVMTVEDGMIYVGKPTGQGNEVTIYYAQGYLAPFLFYRTNGNEFNKAPGLPMQTSEYKGFKKATLNIGRASQVEVYFQDSNGRIDNNKGKNYVFPVGTSTFSIGEITYGLPSDKQVSNLTNNSLTGLDLLDNEYDFDLTETNNVAKIYFKSPYKTPYIRYRIAGGAWNTAPGKKMSASSTYAGYFWTEVAIGTADQIEVRFNNGSGIYTPATGSVTIPAGVSTYAAGVLSAGEPKKTQNNTITIYYKRGYTTPYAYYQPTDGSWLALPGKKMVQSEYAGYSKVTLSIGKAESMKVKIGDGKGKWFKNQYYRFYKGTSTFVNGEISEGKPKVTTAKPATTKKTTTTTKKTTSSSSSISKN